MLGGRCAENRNHPPGIRTSRKDEIKGNAEVTDKNSGCLCCCGGGGGLTLLEQGDEEHEDYGDSCAYEGEEDPPSLGTEVGGVGQVQGDETAPGDCRGANGIVHGIYGCSRAGESDRLMIAAPASRWAQADGYRAGHRPLGAHRAARVHRALGHLRGAGVAAQDRQRPNSYRNTDRLLRCPACI